jgi:hypothetical protein
MVREANEPGWKAERLDFCRLTRPVQDRFITATKGLGIPAPVLTGPVRSPSELFVWMGIAVAGLALLLMLCFVGLGDLASRVAVHGKGLGVLHALLAGALLLGVAQALATAFQTSMLPYRPGVHLFPTAVIDARRRAIVVRRVTEATAIDAGATRLSLRFPDGRTILFPVAKAEDARHAAEVLGTSCEALARALSEGDKKSVAALDPLAAPSFVNPFAPTTPIELSAPFPVRYAWAIGPIIGLGFGLATFTWHNAASDRRMLEHAIAANTPDAYALYLARGGVRPEVREVLLPRTELHEAQNKGGLAAVERYAASHPDSRVEPEIRAALKTLLLVELEEKAKVGTISALNEFKTQHPAKLVEPELRRAVHGVYAKALTSFQRVAGSDEKANLAVEKVLAYAEKTTPKVDLRFVRKLGKSVDVADASIKKSPFFMGQPSVPSQYFDEAHAKVREDDAAQKIILRFGQVFAPDVLALATGAPAEGTMPPAVTVPTIFVETQVQLSGASFLSANPRGVFVGLTMKFEVSIRLPDEPKPFKWSTDVWRSPDTTLEKGERSYEETVYGAMATDAYQRFVTRLQKELFKTPEP